MFGNIAFDATTAIDRHNNFRNIFQANLMLFRYVYARLRIAKIINVGSIGVRLVKLGQTS